MICVGTREWSSWWFDIHTSIPLAGYVSSYFGKLYSHPLSADPTTASLGWLWRYVLLLYARHAVAINSVGQTVTHEYTMATFLNQLEDMSVGERYTQDILSQCVNLVSALRSSRKGSVQSRLKMATDIIPNLPWNGIPISACVRRLKNWLYLPVARRIRLSVQSGKWHDSNAGGRYDAGECVHYSITIP